MIALALFAAFLHPTAQEAPTVNEFTIVMLPDTQKYVNPDAPSPSDTFEKQTEWIAASKTALDIVFVTHVGDIVDGKNSSSQWALADTAMDLLDGDLGLIPDGVIPYATAGGNHDLDVPPSGTELYLSYFGPGRYGFPANKRSWFGNSVSANSLATYQVFAADGELYLHLALEWIASDETLAWAQEVLAANPELPTIITTHEYLALDGTRLTDTTATPGGNPYSIQQPNNSGDDMYRKLVEPFPQVFMVLCGHRVVNAVTPATAYTDSLTTLGEQTIEVLANFQKLSHGGEGWLRLLQFDLERSVLRVRTSSPVWPIDPTLATSTSDFSVHFDHNFDLSLDLRQRRSDARERHHGPLPKRTIAGLPALRGGAGYLRRKRRPRRDTWQ